VPGWGTHVPDSLFLSFPTSTYTCTYTYKVVLLVRPLSAFFALEMSESGSETEPHLLVEKCGSNRGNPIYVITKYIPSVSVFE
jgi:hypothetical protein